MKIDLGFYKEILKVSINNNNLMAVIKLNSIKEDMPYGGSTLPFISDEK
jgi:hypothetical protein